jgi:hypothetical protein
MATIRKHREKWQVQIRRGGLPHVSRTFILKSDAETWVRQMEVEADWNDLPIDPRKLKCITVSDLIRRYRDTIVVKKRGREIATPKQTDRTTCHAGYRNKHGKPSRWIDVPVREADIPTISRQDFLRCRTL